MEKITEAMVQSGDVYVEVYPMVHIEGGARLIEGRHEKPDFWDVALSPHFPSKSLILLSCY